MKMRIYKSDDDDDDDDDNDVDDGVDLINDASSWQNCIVLSSPLNARLKMFLLKMIIVIITMIINVVVIIMIIVIIILAWFWI